MDQDKKHDIALMRYSAISPVITGLQENYSSLDAFYRDASAQGIISPDGSVRHFSPARIGSVVHYDQPYTPTQKAKIERWFRTLKDQWMSCLDIRDFHTLDELRGNLLAYVHNYNQSPHSSLKGMSPQDRFFREPDYIRRLSFVNSV